MNDETARLVEQAREEVAWFESKDWEGESPKRLSGLLDGLADEVERLRDERDGLAMELGVIKDGFHGKRTRSIIEEGQRAVLSDDFYRCPNTGEWVYQWADERLTLNVPQDLLDDGGPSDVE